MSEMNLKNAVESQSVIRGEGEMADLTRTFNWAGTPLGPIDQWPQSLQTTVNILLNTKFPMFLWWGEELIQFYNDAYRPSLGEMSKHPGALGNSAVDSWKEIWHIIYPLIQEVRNNGTSTWSEDQLVPIVRNGTLEDVYWTFGYSPVYDEMGKVGGVLVVCTETTQKIIDKIKLEESERSIKNMILQAPVAMCILDGPEYIVKVVNEPMCELWGKTREEVFNKPVFVGLPEAREQGLEDLLENVYTTGERFSTNERIVYLPRNGKIEATYLNFVYQALIEPDGKIKSILALALDVTKQVLARMEIESFAEKMESKIAERTKELQKMNGELQSFAYVASHDLQEPLRKIQTFSDRIMEKDHENLSDAGKNYFQRLQSAASRMQQFINDLLNYSRTNNKDQSTELTDLHKLFKEVIHEMKDMVQEKQAVIDMDVHFYAKIIPYQFRQVVQNLIANSLKFSRPDVPPHITINVAIQLGKELGYEKLLPEQEYCHMRFTDNGIGFEEQYKFRIFEMFQRLNGRSEYAGSGIGLAIVSKIVENHKGFITARGEPGKGTQFDIYIPNPT
jgi:hypothetical protein